MPNQLSRRRAAPPQGLDPDTAALLADMTVRPSAPRISAYDRFIRALKSAGVWDVTDAIYLPAAHDAQAARLNLKRWTSTVTNGLRTSNPIDTPGALTYGAEATDNVELIANWNLASDPNGNGFTETATGGSSFSYVGAGALTMNYVAGNLFLDASFATPLIGHRYTVRVAQNSAYTGSFRIDIGKAAFGGQEYLSSSSMPTAAVGYYSFIAQSATAYVRIRGATAGTASLHSLSAMLGGIPSFAGTSRTWVFQDSGYFGKDIYMRVVSVGNNALGKPGLQVRFFGTVGTSAWTSSNLRQELIGGGAPAANPNEVWTATGQYAIVAGSLSGIAGLYMGAIPANGSSSLAGIDTSIAGVGATPQQISATVACPANTTNIYQYLKINALANATIDITIEIAAPMLSQIDTVPNYVPTTTATASQIQTLRRWNLVAVNSPTFTTDQGYAGNGSSSYLESYYNPTSSGGQWAQDSAGMFVWSRTELAAAVCDIGIDSTVDARIRPRTAGGTFGVVLNDNTVDSSTNDTSVGFYGVTRDGTTSKKSWRNGVQFGPTYATASVGVPNGTFKLGSDGITFSAHQLAAASWCKALTDAQVAALYAANQNFLQAVGAA